MPDKFYIDPDYIDDYFESASILSEYYTLVVNDNTVLYKTTNDIVVNNIRTNNIHINNILQQSIVI